MTLPLTLSLVLTLPFQHAIHEPDSLVFAGGCYWGVEAVFDHVRGVTEVVAGFAIPATEGPGEGSTRANHAGYAEAVRCLRSR